MARRPKTKKKTKQVDDYEHKEATRLNNPPSGLAWQDTEKPPKRKFEYDPHLDPQLIWASKAERTSFEVEAPSIHVHEFLSAERVIRAVQKEQPQLSFFESPELDRSKQVEFYKHEMDWYNRLILGDSLVVMTSLLEKERLGRRVQMIYIDPPYGIDYKSNFQPRLSSTKVGRSDKDLTREPEQVQAYRDTWQLGIHSYLTYLRDRLRVSHELLSESGSIFVQIGDDNLHLVRTLLDEVFGVKNFVSVITLQKTTSSTTKRMANVADYLLWYAKDVKQLKYRPLHAGKALGGPASGGYNKLIDENGQLHTFKKEWRLNPQLVPKDMRVCKFDNLTSDSPGSRYEVTLGSKNYWPGGDSYWKTDPRGMERLAKAKRLAATEKTLYYLRYFDDFSGIELNNVWSDVAIGGFGDEKIYVVQTNTKIVSRCLLMTTDPGDLVIDPTCGSGTMAFVAERWGRRWITCDTSRVALAVARERLLTSVFDFYSLTLPERGVDGGFVYESIPHVTLGSIANNARLDEVTGKESLSELEKTLREGADDEILYDRPLIDASRVRVSGPFTIEALSRYSVNPAEIDDRSTADAVDAQDHVTSLLDALQKQGIPGQPGEKVKIDSLQRLSNAGFIQAEGTFLDAKRKEKSFAVSLGPRFGPITVAQIDEALHDAYGYDLVVFAGFAADPEAQKYVAKGKLGRFNVVLLAVNPDLLIGDLLKTTSSSQTFRLFASPDVNVKSAADGNVTVEVVGIDSFDAATGELVSRSQADVAAWFLDQDYDGIVFHVTQAFFPKTNAWQQLQKALKETINGELMEQLNSFESLPFKQGERGKAAVRVIDDFGNASEVVLDLVKD